MRFRGWNRGADIPEFHEIEGRVSRGHITYFIYEIEGLRAFRHEMTPSPFVQPCSVIFGFEPMMPLRLIQHEFDLDRFAGGVGHP